MATHSSILAWRIPWIEEPGGLQSMGVTKSQTGLSTHVSHPSHQVMSCGTSILKRRLYFHLPFPGVCGTLCNQDPHFTEVLSNCLM